MRDVLPADRRVTVIGGGFGGLSAAAYLARAGADVTLLERHDRVGGHAGVIEREGFRFDTGPSWYLMPDVFERFFGHFGREPTDHYGLERLDPQYRVFWKDGDRATVRPNTPSRSPRPRAASSARQRCTTPPWSTTPAPTSGG